MIELVAPEPLSLASPCVNICTMDAASGWCRGCGRTIREIANWSAKPPEERRAILMRLPPRLAALKAKGAR